jgi:hypothetical protein
MLIVFKENVPKGKQKVNDKFNTSHFSFLKTISLTQQHMLNVNKYLKALHCCVQHTLQTDNH